MTDHYLGLCESLSRIGTASSSTAVWSIVRGFISRLGYSYFIGADASKVVGGVREATFCGDAPADFVALLDRSIVMERHPFVLSALKSSIPITVSELRRDPEFADQPWIELLHDTVKHGDGLIVPVYRDHEVLAFFNFAGPSPNLSAIARSTLQVLAHAAFDRHVEFRDGTTPQISPALSVRETQCLRYIATGHEDAQISQILGISPRTVRFHVDSAKAKLGAGSRVQAIAKALRDHIIAV